MGPLRNVAWGLIVVVIDININRWDLVPDPIGWAMVALALSGLRTLHSAFGVAAAAAGLGLVASVPAWFGVDPWPIGAAIGVAQVAVLFATCTAIMDLVPARRQTANGLRWWGLVPSLALIPVALVAAGTYDEVTPLVLLVIALAIPVAIVFIWFLVLLFQCARTVPIPAEPSLPPLPS